MSVFTADDWALVYCVLVDELDDAEEGLAEFGAALDTKPRIEAVRKQLGRIDALRVLVDKIKPLAGVE